MILPEDTRWQVPSAGQLLWCDLEGVQAVFDPRSGDTHLLDLISREIVLRLAEAPASVPDVTAVITALLETPEDQPLRTRIADTFDELDRAGLIFPLASGS